MHKLLSFRKLNQRKQNNCIFNIKVLSIQSTVLLMNFILTVACFMRHTYSSPSTTGIRAHLLPQQRIQIFLNLFICKADEPTIVVEAAFFQLDYREHPIAILYEIIVSK